MKPAEQARASRTPGVGLDSLWSSRATLFGSLWAMADEGPKWAAVTVTIGLAISLIPILIRLLPPLAKDAKTNKRDPDYVITVVGLLLYVVVVAGVLILLDVE
jgi:hypothetical protein